MSLNFYLVFLLFVLFNLVLLKKFDLFTKFINVYDNPDFFRKRHEKSTPVVGGFVIYINLIFILLIDFFLTQFFLSNFFNIFEFFSFFLIFSFFFILGFYDDKYQLSASLKLIISTTLLFVLLILNSQLILDNLFFTTFKLNISLTEYSLVVTVISILLFQNSINMFDGSNLQFANFSFICILFFLIKSNFNPFFLLIVIPFIFYWYLNKNKYSFLGDGGALSLSFFFSIFFIKFYQTNIVSNAEDIVVLMLVPGFDMFRLFLLRILNKKNPFSADENHVHHVLFRIFKNNGIVQLIIFFMSFFSILIYYLFDNLIYSILLLLVIFAYIVKHDKIKNS
jgi:UDP-GlcNAc:undecaprenyl-phosphate/decaprenyl-phosphate GlcNAc-1-phosphate transferase